jgi:hypothetical protein
MDTIILFGLIALTSLSLLAQVPSVYYTFIRFSRLSGDWRVYQSRAFCVILSFSILLFVLMGLHWLALIGAILETIFNMYYYSQEFWQNGYGVVSTKHERGGYTHRIGDDKDSDIDALKYRSRLRWWRQNWIAVVIAFIKPLFIYIFSLLMEGRVMG